MARKDVSYLCSSNGDSLAHSPFAGRTDVTDVGSPVFATYISFIRCQALDDCLFSVSCKSELISNDIRINCIKYNVSIDFLISTRLPLWAHPTLFINVGCCLNIFCHNKHSRIVVAPQSRFIYTANCFGKICKRKDLL